MLQNHIRRIKQRFEKLTSKTSFLRTRNDIFEQNFSLTKYKKEIKQESQKLKEKNFGKIGCNLTL